MDRKKVLINDNEINIDDIIEISEFVNNEQRENLPYGYSIVLKDYSIINVVCNPGKEERKSKQDLIFSSYQRIKNHIKTNQKK
jgi:hypothetical protein